MPISCTNCGATVVVPEGHTRPKLRCGQCGYYTVVPADSRAPEKDTPQESAQSAPPPPERTAKIKSAKRTEVQREPEQAPDQHARRAKPNNNSIDPRPNFESDEPSGQYLLEGDDIEYDDGDDTTPYAVPGTGTMRCPDCRGELPLDATLCVHCGTDLQSKKKKAKREYTPLYKAWDMYLPLDLRLKIFAGMQIFNVLLFLAAVFLKYGAVTGFFSMFFQSLLQAFLLGTYQKLIVTRTVKGRADMQKIWRICFVPLAPEKIDWRVSHGVGVAPVKSGGCFEWVMFFYLLTCCILPGVAFYWFVLRTERFECVLCDVHGSTDQMIFRTTKQFEADEICSTISEVTTLMYRKVI